MSAEDEEELPELEAPSSEETDDEDTVYAYRIPVEYDNGVRRPAYSPNVKGKQYAWHMGGNYLTIVQEKGAGYFHRDDVAVTVTELDKEEVEEAGAVVRELVY